MSESGAPVAPAAQQAVPLETASGSIAGADRLEQFSSLPLSERATLDAPLRGVLAETALTGLQRYEWRLLAPLLHSLVDAVLADFGRQEAEVEGPPRPPPAGFESVDALAARLHALLDGHEAAPFTLQRLCEVLLEPRRQYARLDKVAVAIEKLLMVTSTRQPDAQLPPPPSLATLGGVNVNPKSPYLDGRPPQVLDPQQHQARLQQHAQAMAAAQQQLRQQQEQEGRLGLPNGLEQGGAGHHTGADDGQPAGGGEAAGAAGEAPTEAMQLEAAAFVESALADPAHAGANAAGANSGSGSEGNPGHAASGGSSEPAARPASPVAAHTSPDQQQPSPSQQQEQHQGSAVDRAGEGAPAESPDASEPASMDIDAAAPEQQQAPQQPEAQQPSEACRLDGTAAGLEATNVAAGAADAAAGPQHEQQ